MLGTNRVAGKKARLAAGTVRKPRISEAAHGAAPEEPQKVEARCAGLHFQGFHVSLVYTLKRRFVPKGYD
jgi:hypothetical protein